MKILAIDIETSPTIAYTWGLFDQNIGINQIIEPSRVICFAAKWYGERGKPAFYSEWDLGHDEMIAAAHALIDEADVVMHYNGKSFDMPHLHREFVEAGLTPPAPYKEIDLYWTVRRRFKFASTRLGHVAQELGIGGKVPHEGFDLWRKVLDGDEVAQRKMRKYNVQDVTLLEDLYDILKPWVPNHPNVNLVDGPTGTLQCPVCGSGNVQRRGFAYTAQGKFQQYQCQVDGKWFRGTKRLDGVPYAQVA